MLLILQKHVMVGRSAADHYLQGRLLLRPLEHLLGLAHDQPPQEHLYRRAGICFVVVGMKVAPGTEQKSSRTTFGSFGTSNITWSLS